MTDRPTYIYALCEPGTEVAAGEIPPPSVVRYVGKTVNLRVRFQRHLQAKQNRHSASWVKSLKVEGMRPTLCVLEVASSQSWEERERYWIAYYRVGGADLTNFAEGGRDNGGWHHSDATKARITLVQHELWTPAKRKEHGVLIKKAREQPGVKERHADGVRVGKRTKAARATASRNLKARFDADPSSYERMRAGLTPEVIAQRNANIKAAWARKKVERAALSLPGTHDNE